MPKKTSKALEEIRKAEESKAAKAAGIKARAHNFEAARLEYCDRLKMVDKKKTEVAKAKEHGAIRAAVKAKNLADAEKAKEAKVNCKSKQTGNAVIIVYPRASKNVKRQSWLASVLSLKQ